MKDPIIGTWKCFAQKPNPRKDTIVAVQDGQAPDLIFESDGTAKQYLKKRFGSEEDHFRWKQNDDGTYAFYKVAKGELHISMKGIIHKNGNLTTRAWDENSKRAGIITFYKKAKKS